MEGSRRPELSVLLTTYNRPETVIPAVQSILSQEYQDYELLIWDDSTEDLTETRIAQIKDERIRYHRNTHNLGLGRNLQSCYEAARGEFVFLMCDDDLVLPNALMRTVNAFRRGRQIGAVTRPYYWFWNDPARPIRAVLPYDSTRDTEISIFEGKEASRALIRSAGQISGLAFRKEYMDSPFHTDIFTTHIWPLMSILKKHKAIYLKDFTVAVRTPLSMTTNKPEIYEYSPLYSWIKMFECLYGDAHYREIQKECIQNIIEDTYSGFLQIGSTASRRLVLREMQLALRYYPKSTRKIQFYTYIFISIALPKKMLRLMVDWYKRNILSWWTAKALRRWRIVVPWLQ